jgi:hypothetical protein
VAVCRGPFLTSPLGANIWWSCPPGNEFCSLGVKFSVRPSILLNRESIHPWDGGERTGARGEVKNGPLGFFTNEGVNAMVTILGRFGPCFGKTNWQKMFRFPRSNSTYSNT